MRRVSAATTTSIPALLPWLTPSEWHHVFEVVAFFVAGRLAWSRSAGHVPALADRRRRFMILAGAVAGAALGAKVLYALQFAGDLAARAAPLSAWLGGKTIVGGLLGAIAGVELAKRAVGIRGATGDAFVAPLAAGMAIGRLGCFVAGLADGTYGTASSLPWAVDFGDGVSRHPTQLYEALAVAVLGWVVVRLRRPSLRVGDRFRIFVLGYLGVRFAVDFLKPPFGPASALVPLDATATRYFGCLTAIQLACLGGIALYAAAGFRVLRSMHRPGAE